MKKFLLAGLSMVAMASAANAQDVSEAAPASPFAGPYVGVQLGVGQLQDVHNDWDEWYWNARDAKNSDKGVIGGIRRGRPVL